jgi:hypothetical protein
MDDDAATRLVAKIRDFVADNLSEEERVLFAALLAPGVAQAYNETDVAGFAMVDWSSGEFPDALGRALRQAHVRVTGLDP